MSSPHNKSSSKKLNTYAIKQNLYTLDEISEKMEKELGVKNDMLDSDIKKSAHLELNNNK